MEYSYRYFDDNILKLVHFDSTNDKTLFFTLQLQQTDVDHEIAGDPTNNSDNDNSTQSLDAQTINSDSPVCISCVIEHYSRLFSSRTAVFNILICDWKIASIHLPFLAKQSMITTVFFGITS